MREIKFRGIDTESNKWIYGGYVLLKSGVNCILSGEVSHMTLPGSHPRSPTYEELNVLQFHAVKYKTVGEYTGLHDKNGKEIYEGDIVKYEQFIGVVVWDYSGLMLKVNGIIYAIWRGCEIIGNIYENPELLKES